jgi:hypothetical protein
MSSFKLDQVVIVYLGEEKRQCLIGYYGDKAGHPSGFYQ